MNSAKATCNKLSPKDRKRGLDHLRKNSKVAPRALLSKEKRLLSEDQLDLKHMRIALANLEAALRLLTKNKINCETKRLEDNSWILINNFNTDLGRLINEFKGHVNSTECLVDYSKRKIAELRKAA